MRDQELASRAVACKGWRWMPGMLPLDGTGFSHRILRVREDGMPIDGHGALPDAVPDLSDPATLGCLLALVREAWGVPDLYVAPVEYVGPGPAPAWRAWAVEGPDLHVYTTSGKTEAAALVAALEAAP